MSSMVVALHRESPVPKDDFHLPVHVGRALGDRVLPYQADDEGENISARNASYCELTALYWAWRNHDGPALGLSHYRRYFAGGSPGPGGTSILGWSEAEELLERVDMVVARRRHYVIETVASHYAHAHVAEDLDLLREAVGRVSPDMNQPLERVLRRRSLSLYNMFLARRPLADEYCAWLFAVLGEVEAQIDLTRRGPYQQRALGFLGERLLNVWLEGRPDLVVARRRVVHVEGEDVIPKAWGMLRRRVVGATSKGHTDG